jgi:hypothetical protein
MKFANCNPEPKNENDRVCNARADEQLAAILEGATLIE